MGWYVTPTLPPDKEWKGFVTKEYILASESPYDLRLTPEDFFLTPEETQASREAWDVRPDEAGYEHLWTIVDESTVPDPLDWYLETEPEPFYPSLLDLSEFYGQHFLAPDFYWSQEVDLFYLPGFDIELAPSTTWNIFYNIAPSRFYISPVITPSFYWVLINDMVD